MLNRQTTYAASPLLEDIDADDRRVEVAAAREIALVHALKINDYDDTAQEVVAVANNFEAFLLAHPATGDRALNFAADFCHKISWNKPSDRLEVAAVFADYLANGHRPEPSNAG